MEEDGLLSGFGRALPQRQRAWRAVLARLPPAAAPGGGGGKQPLDPQIARDVERCARLAPVHGATERGRRLLELQATLAAVFPWVPPASSSPPPAATPTAAAAAAPRALHYYQGLHDVAAVLLLGGGPRAAPRLLRALLGPAGPLPYAGPAGVPLALDALQLLLALLAGADAQLHRHLLASGVAPHWGLSWLLTCFAHDVSSADAALRLCDAFVCGHCLLPVYAAAALLARHRDAVLRGDPHDTGAFHQLLKQLPSRLRDARAADELVWAALALFRAQPPAQALAALHATAPQAAARLRHAWLDAALGEAHFMDDDDGGVATSAPRMPRLGRPRLLAGWLDVRSQPQPAAARVRAAFWDRWARDARAVIVQPQRSGARASPAAAAGWWWGAAGTAAAAAVTAAVALQWWALAHDTGGGGGQ